MTAGTSLLVNADSFWRYSISKYALDDVKKSTLMLQDEYAFNVNLLLFCMLCDANAYVISKAFVSDLKQAILPSDYALIEHRKKRRQAKVNNNEVTSDYEALLTQELALEAQQQTLIVSSFLAGGSNILEQGEGSSSLLNYLAIQHSQANNIKQSRALSLIDVLRKHV